MPEDGFKPHFKIPPIDPRWSEQASRHQACLTKPAGSLGELETLAIQLASLQETSTPTVRPAHVLVFASDHPVVSHGVSAYPQEVTTAMIGNMLTGGAASTVLARQFNIPMSIIDVGVKTPQKVQMTSEVQLYRSAPAANGSVGDLADAQAMDQRTFDAAIMAGIEAVDRLGQCSLLIVGELGIGNTTVAAAVTAALLNVPAETMVGRGTGVDDEGMIRKRMVVERALLACDADDGASTIMQIGGRDIAAMYGAMGRAAEKNIPILVDGFVAGSAALALIHDYPDANKRLIWAHRSAEQGHIHLLRKAGAKGLLDLGMRLGEASGALAAVPLIEAACALHNGMATFAEAQVPEKDPSP